MLIFASSYSMAWQGYSYEEGKFIDIEGYDHQGIGEGPVEYFDYGDGSYKTGYLDMYPGGTGTLCEDDTGDCFDVDMD